MYSQALDMVANEIVARRLEEVRSARLARSRDVANNRELPLLGGSVNLLNALRANLHITLGRRPAAA